MAVAEQLRPGYKRTDVGIIPDDWEVKKIIEFTDCTAGGTPSTLIPNYWGGSIRWMNSGELNDKKIIDVEGRITERGLKESSTKIVPIGCVLIGLAGQGKTRGTAAINRVELCTNQSIAAIYPSDLHDSDYLYFNLDKRYKELRGLSTGGEGRGGLNLSIIRNIPIPFPKKTEQTLIATVLSDVDALIASLDALIAKKRDIKQGAMQELLSGKKRLPGFNGEWKKAELQKLTQIPISDGPHLTPRFLDDGIPFLSVNNLVDNRIDWSNVRFISKKDHDEFSKKCRPQKNDLLLGKAASVGLIAVADEDFEFNVWSPIAVIRLNDQHVPHFFYYSFQSRQVTSQIKLLTNSSSQGNIGMGEIEKIEFLVPSKEEQSAIASLLFDIDQDIFLLEGKRDKYLMLKQGMMQQLLTGSVRLI